MEDSCRICGSGEGIKINIFEPGSEYVRKIHKILPITVSLSQPDLVSKSDKSQSDKGYGYIP